MVTDIVLAAVGLMLFLFSEHQINRMTRQTRASIRLAFSMNALSGVCFVVQSFAGPSALYAAFVLCVCGCALLMLANRRIGCVFGCRDYDAFWRKQDANIGGRAQTDKRA